MSAAGVYVLGGLAAWPVITLVLAARLAHLRRGPTFSTVATLAALAAVVWPLALVVLYLAPRPGRRP